MEKNSTSQKLSKKQRQFVEYLADPDSSDSPESAARKIGISRKTLERWKSNPVIVQSAFRLSITRMGAEIPKVLKMLLEKALGDGNITAGKMLLQQSAKMSEVPDAGITVDEALRLINKVIMQQREHDADTQ